MTLENALKYYFEICNIPMAVYENGERVFYVGSNEFTPDVARRYAHDAVIANYERNADVVVTKDYLMCGFVKEKCGGRWILLGPVFEFECKMSTARNILADIGEPTTRLTELMAFLKRTPKMPFTTFNNHILFLNYIVNEEEPDEKRVPDVPYSAVEPKLSYESRNFRVLHNTPEYERVLCSYVEYGKTEEVRELLKNRHNMGGRLGIIGNDSIRSMKNMVIISIGFFSRKAIDGGLDFETSLNASDVYLREVEKMNTHDELNELWCRMFLDYTQQVEKIRKLNPRSELVRKITAYVYDNVYEKISVDAIAERMGYNASYICRAFKKETGKTLSGFIAETKVEEAKRQLMSTDLKLAEVSSALGFASQSYFQTVFKKNTGVSPAKFRTP